jgi:predicted CXXCH cytochrome family protein
MADSRSSSSPDDRTSKGRAKRIPLDYYKKPDLVSNLKTAATAIVGVILLLWVVRSVDFSNLIQGKDPLSSAAKRDSSHGELSFHHAAWDTKCEACHLSFRPIKGGEVITGLVARPDLVNKNCETCHAGPPHHQNIKESKRINECTACHSEHQGRNFSLVNLKDRSCTQCHGNLAEAMAEPNHKREEADKSIEKFTVDSHPEFRPVREQEGKVPRDPSHLKFNHALHMNLGMAAPGGKPFFKYSDITSHKEQYGHPSKPDEFVQLSCTDCHQSTASLRDGSSTLIDERNFVPVQFNNHCVGCHSLDVPKQPTELIANVAKNWNKTPEERRATSSYSSAITIPHGEQPSRINELLQSTYFQELISHDKTTAAELSEPLEMPGPQKEIARKLQATVDSEVNFAEEILYLGQQTCSKCHSYVSNDGKSRWFEEKQPSPDQQVDFRKAIAANEFKVEATKVPSNWMPGAVFSHKSHRAVDCKQCHAAAYPSSDNRSVSSKDVMLPGITNCVPCHAPHQNTVKGPIGGVRHDCVECHRYHDVNFMTDRLPRPSAPDQRRTIEEFLSPASVESSEAGSSTHNENGR